MYFFNYIITIHNKENLIAEVLNGVIKCAGNTSTIYPVLDGCTDRTEEIIDEIRNSHPNIKIVKLYAPDVHEIKSLNIALKTITQTDRTLNITLQDDVIINEIDLESKISKIYDFIGYEKIGTLAFRHGVNVRLDHQNKMIRETDLTESVYGIGMSNNPLPHNMLIERMAPVRSPECISSHVINTVGLFDEELAPYMWDNHDLSLRCLKAGLHNYVFALPFISDAKWGGMKTNPHPNQTKVDLRNRSYLYKKHFEFLNKKSNKRLFQTLRITKPIVVPSITINPANKNSTIIAYYSRRKQLISSTLKLFYIDVIKKNIRTFMYLLISVKLHLIK